MFCKEEINIDISDTLLDLYPDNDWDIYIDLTIEQLNNTLSFQDKLEDNLISTNFYNHEDIEIGIATFKNHNDNGLTMFIGLVEEVETLIDNKNKIYQRLNILISKKSKEFFSPKKINKFINKTLINLNLDGINDFAVIHIHKTKYGKFYTFSTYFKDMDLVIFIGKKKELSEIKRTFKKFYNNHFEKKLKFIPKYNINKL